MRADLKQPRPRALAEGHQGGPCWVSTKCSIQPQPRAEESHPSPWPSPAFWDIPRPPRLGSPWFSILDPVLRGIKQITIRTKNKTLKSVLRSKSLQSEYMFSLTLESCNVHMHMKVSAKSCNKSSCFKCLKSIYPKTMAPPCTSWETDSFQNTGLYHCPTLWMSILACKWRHGLQGQTQLVFNLVSITSLMFVFG